MKSPKKIHKWGYGIKLQHPEKKKEKLKMDGDYYESRRCARVDQSMKTIDRPVFINKHDGGHYKLGSFKNVVNREDLF